ESLNITEERLAELGMEGFAAPVQVTCEDHSGHHNVYVAQWDGQKWTRLTDWTSPMTEYVRPLIQEAAASYASGNPGWPTRSEECDNN
ncbi:MAG TPA: ABC transporter permease, partial [Saliniramus sp.]|nr:ABC transporter permease [Saliniramus sp.]